MIGLSVLAFAGVYLAISFAAVVFAIKRARAKGRSSWKWAGAAAFIMYNLVFWDWIPTVVIHRYSCATESGFWVYKTADQWKSEHPGVFETLEYNFTVGTTKRLNADSEINTSPLNQRFAMVSGHDGNLPLHRVRIERTIVDIPTGEVLARYIDFRTAPSQGLPRLLQLWLYGGPCQQDAHREAEMRKLRETYRGAKSDTRN